MNLYVIYSFCSCSVIFVKATIDDGRDKIIRNFRNLSSFRNIRKPLRVRTIAGMKWPQNNQNSTIVHVKTKDLVFATSVTFASLQ